MMFGRFVLAPNVRFEAAQLGRNEVAPIEAAAKPEIFRNSRLVFLSIIIPFDDHCAGCGLIILTFFSIRPTLTLQI